MTSSDPAPDSTPEAIAIVAMACRFPGARTPEEFIENLLAGKNSVLPEAEWPERLRQRAPRAGRAAGLLEDVDLLDAGYFGLTPREAEVMDPQQRLFLECAAEALQRAGCESDLKDRLVGVYAGMGINSYFLRHLLTNPHLVSGVDAFQVMASNEKDFIATQTSYRLDLKGPSISVSTACSTSLVAVAMACDALLSRQCDVALAGGSSIKPDPAFGSFLEEGGIATHDGNCRAFDAAASGTVGGSGVGAVVLKRLSDALAEDDSIVAVIRGWAVNNDGARKVGFSAPSVEGQAAVIAEAQAMAGTPADTITLLEAHGTGTPVGDPIEVAALTRAFRATTERTGYCALGSVKTNVGHLDAAAGVAGLMKAALSLERRRIPASLHFTTPNPALNLPATPFYVPTAAIPWPQGPTPRRAGVSSFGIGGTNAHVILEEAPPRGTPPPEAPRPHAIVLSARSPTALDRAALDLADAMERAPHTALADVAFTLQAGRRRHGLRRALVCASREEAVASLRAGAAARRSWTQANDARELPVAFLFPGQGAQHVDMARGLYETEPRFREDVDRCCELLRPHLGLDLRTLLYPAPEAAAEAARRLTETRHAQPALFVVEFALARLWMRWGVKPRALLGHSIGEYVAACLAGVFTLEDALALVAARGRLMQDTAEGAMLAVPLAEAEVRASLPEGLSIAAVNAPASCVVSGAPAEIERYRALLAARGIEGRSLAVTRGFHSPLMEPVLDAFEALVAKVPRSAPRLPFVSNLTGDWITVEEATSPAYWARHLRHAVRFSDGVVALVKRNPGGALLEVGPGRSLSSLAARNPARGPAEPVLASLRHADDASVTDAVALREALARLWISGAAVDWRAVHSPRKPRVVPLPTYPFERQRYWVEPGGPPLGETPAGREPIAGVSAATMLPTATPQHARPPLPSAYAAPATPLEEGLVAQWEEAFGFKGIGVNDDFFELGGHSLLAARLASKLKEAYGVDVPLSMLFEARTVAQLAAIVERALLEEISKLTEEEARHALESR